MSTKKCIKCDGLGYYHNLETFRSEYCPDCVGKGIIETVMGPTPVDVPEMPLVAEEPVVVEAPKPKKSAKAKVDLPPTSIDYTGLSTPIEPQADEIATDGQPE